MSLAYLLHFVGVVTLEEVENEQIKDASVVLALQYGMHVFKKELLVCAKNFQHKTENCQWFDASVDVEI